MAGDGAPFNGSVLSSSISRNNAMFAQYLQSEEYTELWRDASECGNCEQDASDDELEPSTLFAQDSKDNFACYMQTAENTEYWQADVSEDEHTSDEG